MINFFLFAFLEEYDGRIAAPAVIPDLTHERPALIADEHMAVVDVPGMEVDPLTAVGGIERPCPPYPRRPASHGSIRRRRRNSTRWKPSTVQTLPLQLAHVAHVLSLMIEYPFPVVTMLIPSLDDLALQLHVVGPALVGKRIFEHIVDLRERVALRTPGFDGPAGSQVIIDYLDVQVFGRMALRTRFHNRHSPSPLSLWIRDTTSLHILTVQSPA